MKGEKILTIGIVILLAILTGTLELHSTKINVNASSSNPVHNLTTGLNYTTIQEAIDVSETLNGHTIFIEDGLYYENVVVHKEIHLIGENKETSIIDARNIGYTLELTTDGILIANLTISYGEVGIHITSSHNHVIRNNILRKNTRGATGDYYTGTIYDGNIVKENDYGLDFGHLGGASSSNNTAIYNEIYDNFAGVYVSASDGNNSIIYNIIHDNNIGVVLDHTRNNSITGNVIRNNNRVGGYDYGIYLRNSFENLVTQNLFLSNNGGMCFEGSDNNWIFHNNFEMNFMHTIGSSTNIWDDGYPSGGNYWDDYFGVDGNSDGIGDTPYTVDADNTDRYPLMEEDSGYISEFPSLIMFPLFMTLTLLVAFIHRRKAGKTHKSSLYLL